MLKNITRALSLSLLVINPTYADNTLFEPQFKPQFTEEMLNKYGTGFTSLEHKYMGDLIQLHIPGINSSNEAIKLTLPNGLQLSYGEIIMYAGDMFGDPAKPVSSCSTKDKLNCFKSQFEALAVQGQPDDSQCNNPINQSKTIKTYMEGITSDLENSRTNGIPDWEYYDKHDVELTKKMNTLTCGGSKISDFIPYGNYIKLAQTNFDHFAPDSLVAYKVGHQFALQTAQQGFEKRKAGQIKEANQLLSLAYAQNAFANHYLTDSFSAGHMRIPRRAIDHDVHLPAALNLLIANLMHNEDSRHGLNVVNAEGTSWIAYGDGFLFKPGAELQQEVILEAMQRSADGVYTTFLSGQIPGSYPEMNLFPDYEKIAQLNDTAPLFKVENGVLLKRVNNDDVYDNHWTKYWSGFIILMQFKVHN